MYPAGEQAGRLLHVYFQLARRVHLPRQITLWHTHSPTVGRLGLISRCSADAECVKLALPVQVSEVAVGKVGKVVVCIHCLYSLPYGQRYEFRPRILPIPEHTYMHYSRSLRLLHPRRHHYWKTVGMHTWFQLAFEKM